MGGLAVSARAEPRTTRDVDLVVAVSGDSQAEKLVRDLRARGYILVEHLEQDAAGLLATVRFIAPGEDEEGVLVDLLFASSGVEPEIVAQAEDLEIAAGIVLPIATTGHLIALKLLARDDRLRPQDFDDLKALLREASPEDISRAREALQLIIERGYNPGLSTAKSGYGSSVWRSAMSFSSSRPCAVIGRAASSPPGGPRDMSKTGITRVTVKPGEAPPRGETDWAQVNAMTDEEVLAAACSDPDAQPLDPETLAKMRRVSPVKALRQRLGMTQAEFAEAFRPAHQHPAGLGAESQYPRCTGPRAASSD